MTACQHPTVNGHQNLVMIDGGCRVEREGNLRVMFVASSAIRPFVHCEKLDEGQIVSDGEYCRETDIVEPVPS